MQVLLTLLLGCPAADLGVELPPEGIDAISAEDLRRDTELFLREGTAAWLTRMAAMNAVPLSGPRVCVGQGAGAESEPARWAATDVSTGKFTLGDAVDAAALVSLAKAWDTLGNKPGPRLYCLGAGPGQRLPSMNATATTVQEVDFRDVAKALRKVSP
jgi:hypothetical protein